MESHARSIVKALSWRVWAGLITFGVAWAITGRLTLAAEVGLADTAVKLGAYYAHERLWLKVRFGRSKSPDYDI